MVEAPRANVAIVEPVFAGSDVTLLAYLDKRGLSNNRVPIIQSDFGTNNITYAVYHRSTPIGSPGIFVVADVIHDVPQKGTIWPFPVAAKVPGFNFDAALAGIYLPDGPREYRVQCQAVLFNGRLLQFAFIVPTLEKEGG